jgi:hypothetical protein
MKAGSGIQKCIGGDSQTYRLHGDLISLLSFFKNEESSLKIQIFPLREHTASALQRPTD